MSVVWLGHLKGSQLKCNAGSIAVGPIQQGYFLSGLTGYTDKLFSTPVVELNHLMGQLLCVALLVYVASYMSQGSLEHLLMLLGCVTKALFPDAMFFPKTLHQLLKLFNLTPISKEYACCPSCFALYDVSSFSPLQTLHPFPAASCPLEPEGDPALQYASVEAQRFLANAPINQNDEHLPFPYTLPPRLEPCCTHQSVQTAVPCNALLAHDKGQGHYVPLHKYCTFCTESSGDGVNGEVRCAIMCSYQLKYAGPSVQGEHVWLHIPTKSVLRMHPVNIGKQGWCMWHIPPVKIWDDRIYRMIFNHVRKPHTN